MNEDEDRRARLYLELAKSAQGRFDNRRQVEWKVAIGLWTLFGAAAGAVIASENWRPAVWLFWIVPPGVFGILLIYRCMWLPYLAEAFRRDQRTSYYWESGVQYVLKKSLPWELDPRYEFKSGSASRLEGWMRMEDCPMPGACGGKSVDRELHASQKIQFYFTVAFATIFVALLIAKWWNSPPSPHP
jgi:hypothetical protein